MRNRLLNFRTTRVSTVTVVDEQPAEVFRYLALNGKSMKFAAAAQAEIEAATTTGPEDELEIGKAPATQHQLRLAEFAPYERENLHHRHRDGVLQTSASPEQLDRALLRIDAQATATLEEQGVSTLFLALGMLQYRESVDSEEWRRAPLVLLPVALDRKSARAGFTVRASGDDPLVNPAVVELMKSSFGIELPDLPAPDQQTDDYDLQALLSATARAVRQQPDWKVTNEIYLGLFSFQKFVMYKDLEANSAALAQHRLIQRIATREGNSHQGLPPDIREAPLDELFPPESSHQVIDADASQLRALLAAGSGHDLVIEGPPGTGKSQTITNLIAQALGKGNSVLFVAEKMAALEVVAANLERVGLSEFCLEIHSSKANKRSVIEQIKTSLDASLSRPAVSDRARGEIFEARMRTTEYVRSVHAP
ncbi:MAG: DUF4011 domain-containing protein, partial [Thermoanaerobaculia bacterium]|nr:DUF4011 domain-containing protein [Thermoanaerobaculia bacterium]